MPKRSSSPDAARRNFLKGAGLIGAAAAVAPPAANALPAPPTQLKAAVPARGVTVRIVLDPSQRQ